jgi:hypothetical protein
MENRYEDYVCLLTGKPCQRGDTEECPKSVANIVPWCRWFVNKYQRKIKETSPLKSP